MNTFECPACSKEYDIEEIELWEVYEEDGKQTNFTCHDCDAEMVITSTVIGWDFEAILEEDC